jgi:hypothetical protein
MEIEECLYLGTGSNLLLGVFCQSELVASRSCFIKKISLIFGHLQVGKYNTHSEQHT